MHIDLNSDLGESFGRWQLGDDTRLLGLVTSANIACGFHAGDPTTLLHTTQEALTNNVRIGAQVSYADLRGFGRRFIDVPVKELTADIIYQLSALDGICGVHGGAISYVKPHGALYNTTVHHESQAQAIVDAITAFDPSLAVLGLAGSQLLSHAQAAGLRTVTEAFADRAYTDEGTLVPRNEPGAVLHNAEFIAHRMVTLVTEGTIQSITGKILPVSAESLCVHGDSPDAVHTAEHLKAALIAAGINIKSFIDT